MTKTMSRELSALCSQVAQWREHDGGGRGKRIPEALWLQAKSVARVDGVYRTSRATRLNYDRLQARLYEAPRMRVRPGPEANEKSKDSQPVVRGRTRVHGESEAGNRKSTQFVSLQVTPTAAHSHALTIELYSRGGERMRIESAGAVDLTSVVQAFWRMQP